MDNNKSKIKINAYDVSAVRISFLPVRILSSSPKLNFFINTPVAIATAAAGVAKLISHDSIFSKAEFSFVTN